MKPYDPKMNPGKSLEETIQNFIEWIRMSNRNTTSVLRSVNEKLEDISNTEENLKAFEASQAAGLDKINIMLKSLSQITDQNNNQGVAADFNEELKHTLESLTNQVEGISNSFRDFQETIESDFTQGMNKIESAILDVKSDILVINSQLKISLKTTDVGAIEKNVKEELAKIRKQIVCKTENDKAKILTIIDTLIGDLSIEHLEISGLDLKKRMIEARTQVYEQTQGLAPRFRIMMDNFMRAINDETMYSSDTIQLLLIKGILHIREIYQSAPIGLA
ncbi:MAG: Sas10/Utp3/C1D family protein [Candidatus Hodarchaeales archaeon]|jgi:flagellar hook-basal body complex protein FliE